MYIQIYTFSLLQITTTIYPKHLKLYLIRRLIKNIYIYRKCVANKAYAKNRIASLLPKKIHLKKQTLQINVTHSSKSTVKAAL